MLILFIPYDMTTAAITTITKTSAAITTIAMTTATIKPQP
jgi:hypothetical protein